MIRIKKPKGTRRKNFKPKGRSNRKLDALFVSLRRYGLKCGLALFLLWFGIWAYVSGMALDMTVWSQKKLITASADMGFRVQNILVEGRENTDPDVLLGLMNTQKGDPILAFSAQEAQELAEKISWVKSAHIERRLPDTIFIKLEERQPIAIFIRDRGPVLIDEAGEALTDYNLERFENLVTIKGPSANKRAQSIVGMLNAESLIRPKIKEASWVGSRRWDLKTHNGTAIRLPEDDAGLALARLGKLLETNPLLDKPLEYIDLRNTSRIIVKSKPGKVQEFKASFEPGNAI